MHVEFLGTGDGFERSWGNTSLIVSANNTNLLIDCGYAVPERYFAKDLSADFLDGIYITHFHADHVAGLPAVLAYLKYVKNRTKPLRLIGQSGLKETITTTTAIYYDPSLIDNLGYPLEIVESETEATLASWSLRFALTDHMKRNFAIRIDTADGSVGVSGDGRPTPESLELLNGCRLVVHEAHRLSSKGPGHGDAESVVAAVREFPGLETLALVHMFVGDREIADEELEQLAKTVNFDIVLPGPGDLVAL